MVQFQPVRMLEVELTDPLPALSSRAPDGKVYRRARVLVRLHTQPLGVVEVTLRRDGIPAQELAGKILQELQAPIRRHLERDGLSPVALDLAETHPVEPEWAGIPGADPICLKSRRELLADPPPVAVIIATRERPELLTQTMRSVAALDYPNYEVLVVDNAPATGETKNVVAGFAASEMRVRYVREERVGTSAARNRGIIEVDTELVAFTDDDVMVDRHWLTALVEGFSAAPGVACVTGLVMPLELETPSQVWMEQYADYSSGFMPQIFDLGQHRSDRPLYPYNPGVFGSGQNMAFKTAALKGLGGFDPALGPGTPACAGEELAVFFEIVRSGRRLAYRPGAIVHHLNRRDYGDLRAQVHGYGVGLTAYLTKCIVDHPSLLVELIRKAPAGLSLTFNPGSPKHAKKDSSFPKELSRVELKGMILGPPAYVRGRLRVARQTSVAAAGMNPGTRVIARLRLVAGRLSRGLRSALRLAEARRLAPQVLAGLSVPQELPAGDKWEVNSQRLTETGMAVLVLGPAGGEPAAVLKVAATPDAAAALKRQAAVAEALFQDSRLAGWRSLLPLRLGCGEAGGKSYAVERVLPGRPAVELLGEPSIRAVLEAAALDAIGKLHSRTAAVFKVDQDLLDSWVTRPLNALEEAGLSGRSVLQLDEELRASLEGRRLAAGWVHGDFWPGNVLVGGDLTVTGIIDWERAGTPQLAAHDVLHWLLYTRRLLGGGEIGEIVAGLLSGGKATQADRRFLDVAMQASSSLLGERHVLLLYWLRHVASNLIQSPAYARDVLWIRKVVSPVLDVV